MNRRTAFATCALVLVLVTGAVASRQWLDFTPEFGVSDSRGHLWSVKSKFRGRVRLRDAGGQPIGDFSTDAGDPVSGVVHLTYAGTLKADFRGVGRHEVRDTNGDLLGYLELSLLTPNDEEEMQRLGREQEQFTQEMYRTDRVTPKNENYGVAGVNSFPGLLTGYFGRQGVSWKVYGYGQVNVQCLAGDVPEEQQGKSDVPLPAEKLPPAIRETADRLLALAPRPSSPPEIRWTLAGENPQNGGEDVYRIGDYGLKNGEWTAVRESGTLTGYGKHVIKDESGKTVLILEVSPPAPGGPAR